VLGLILDPTVLYTATVAAFAVWLLVLGNRRGGRQSATSQAVTASFAVSANPPEALDHQQEHGHRKDRATDRQDLNHTLPSAPA